jgi:uncharacterized membrane protein YbhN (UPF0104 family)
MAPLPQALDPARLRTGGLRLAALAAAAAAVVAFGPGLDSVRERLENGDPGWLVLAGVLELGSVAAYVVLVWTILLERTRLGLGSLVGLTELGVNSLIPAGGFVGLATGGWVLHRHGLPVRFLVRRSGALFFITSAANVGGVVVVGVLLATGALGPPPAWSLTLLPAAVAALAIAAVLALPRAAARRRDGRAAKALGVIGDSVREAVALLRRGDAWIVLGSLGYVGFDIAVLWATFEAFADAPPVGILVIAYLIGLLGGALPIPGGIGGVDGALIGVLVLYGAPLEVATVATLAYRALALSIPAVLGAFAAARLGATLRGSDETVRHISRPNKEVSQCPSAMPRSRTSWSLQADSSRS